MANFVNNATFSPYGAFELKAKYQRNLLMGVGFGVGLVALVLLVNVAIAIIEGSQEKVVAPKKILTVAELPPPPTVQKQPPQFKTDAPKPPPKVGVPIIADEEEVEEEVQLATQEELADINAPDVSADLGEGIEVDTSDYIPGVDEFVAMEELPQMIFEAKAEYPRMSKDAGIEGIVWIAVLVDKDGSVKESQVYKSSGSANLDEAALAAAPKNKFKPGIQNGKPVPCWVKYKVNFKLS